MLRNCSLFSVAVLSLLWTQSASAHFLWLLTDTSAKPAKVQVFFGEEAEPDNPALLDKVLQAEAWVLGERRGSEPQLLSLKKGTAALEAELPADWQDSAVILRHTYGAMTKKDESFLLKYYAKTYPSPLPGTWRAVKDVERLPLEIVPKPEGSATLLNVTWKGEPVKGDTVTVTGPGLETKWEGTTDDKGVCRVELPQAGLYSIRVRHIEEAAGEHAGRAYKSVKHYSTLALPHAPTRLTATSAGLAPLPHGVTSFGGAIQGDSLYLYGGNYGNAHDYSNADQSGDLWKLDLTQPRKWEKLSGGPKLQGLAMVEHKGSLYRIGGFTATNKEGSPADLRSQPDVARFDVAKQTWENVASLPEGRSSHDTAIIGDTVYVVGGWNLQGQSSTSKWHDTALALNLAAEKPEWKPVASPPFKRRALALGAWNGKLYCLGGMQEKGGTTTAVAVYDPVKNAWSEAPALIGGGMEGFGSSAFAAQGALYVTTMSGSIQRLAGDGKQWEYVGQINHPRFFHRVLPWHEEKLVIVGGANMTTGKTVELEVLTIGSVKTAAK